ncbi:MAG: hypothetical protein E7677_00880 [Ruminococcaceae bacterium]|nr:hypothetical protein [Oscillospiraceae bacterium]
MGFGLLFIGYFVATLMSINMVGPFIRIIGYGIVFIASSKLNGYNRHFRLLQIAAAFMVALSILLSISTVTDFLYSELIISKNIFGEPYQTVIGHVETVMSFIFASVMLYAIRSIATETEDLKISANAIRNFVFMCIYVLLYVVTCLPFAYTKYFGMPTLLIQFAYVVLNLILIFTCYTRICDESDVEMNRKPSRFAFINKMRAELDRREEKALESQAQFIEEKRQKREQKRRKKK